MVCAICRPLNGQNQCFCFQTSMTYFLDTLIQIFPWIMTVNNSKVVLELSTVLICCMGSLCHGVRNLSAVETVAVLKPIQQQWPVNLREAFKLLTKRGLVMICTTQATQVQDELTTTVIKARGASKGIKFKFGASCCMHSLSHGVRNLSAVKTVRISSSFQPAYRSGHPENYLFSLVKKTFLDQSIRKIFNLTLRTEAMARK